MHQAAPTSARLRHQCRRLVIALACLVESCPAGAADALVHVDHAALARTQFGRHIRPGYARLATSAIRFAEALDGFCAGGAAADRRPRETAYDRLVDAWGRIEHINFGPISEANRHERMFFWPDRRGLGARQIATVLATRDPSVLDPAALGLKSVALQGLGALDHVLFLDWPAATDTDARIYRCGFARSIAAGMAATTREVAAAWHRPEGFGGLWLAPGPDNAAYATGAETTAILATALVRGLDRARDQRLSGPLGLGKQRRIMPAPLSAGGRGLRLVAASIDGLQHLYTSGGLRDALTAAADAGNLADVRARSERLAKDLRSLANRLDGLVRQPQPSAAGAATSGIIAVGFPLKSVRADAASLLARIADTAMDFNAADGD